MLEVCSLFSLQVDIFLLFHSSLFYLFWYTLYFKIIFISDQFNFIIEIPKLLSAIVLTKTVKETFETKSVRSKWDQYLLHICAFISVIYCELLIIMAGLSASWYSGIPLFSWNLRPLLHLINKYIDNKILEGYFIKS